MSRTLRLRRRRDSAVYPNLPDAIAALPAVPAPVPPPAPSRAGMFIADMRAGWDGLPLFRQAVRCLFPERGFSGLHLPPPQPGQSSVLDADFNAAIAATRAQYAAARAEVYGTPAGAR
jgi:hypothetical protein